MAQPHKVNRLPPSRFQTDRLRKSQFDDNFGVLRLRLRNKTIEKQSFWVYRPKLLGYDDGVSQPAASAVAPVDLLQLHRGSRIGGRGRQRVGVNPGFVGGGPGAGRHYEGHTLARRVEL